MGGWYRRCNKPLSSFQTGETANEKTMEEIRRDIRSKRRGTQGTQIARPKTVKKNAAAAVGKKSKNARGRKHAKQESFKVGGVLGIVSVYSNDHLSFSFSAISTRY